MEMRSKHVTYIVIGVVTIVYLTRPSPPPLEPKPIEIEESPLEDFDEFLGDSKVFSLQLQDQRNRLRILFLTVVSKGTDVNFYRTALDSLRCYCSIQGYEHLIVHEKRFSHRCKQKDKFFRRHCVAANILRHYDVIVFLDADIGVVTPTRRIEEFLEDGIDVVFYDRFYNQEITMGAYIVRNTNFGRNFLNGFANYESKLPNSFHGTDNGAIHAYIQQTILPNSKEAESCNMIYERSKDYEDVFAFEACMRAMYGHMRRFGKLKIYEKGTGWSRDSWLTNSKWSPKRDFMIHGWKAKDLRTYKEKELPIGLEESSRSDWYNPFVGEFQLNRCNPGNATWLYDLNLIENDKKIDRKLEKFYKSVELNRFKYLARAYDILKKIEEEHAPKAAPEPVHRGLF